MKLVKTAFGWSIYKLEGVKESDYRESWTVEYYVAVKHDNKLKKPVEGKTIGEVLEKIAEQEEPVTPSADYQDSSQYPASYDR